MSVLYILKRDWSVNCVFTPILGKRVCVCVCGYSAREHKLMHTIKTSNRIVDT